MLVTNPIAAPICPSTVRTLEPYTRSVSLNVPASNWNMPRPPCCALHGPSAAPAITGPPPQSGEPGPWQAHVASDQHWARLVSGFATPATHTALAYAARRRRVTEHRVACAAIDRRGFERAARRRLARRVVVLR